MFCAAVTSFFTTAFNQRLSMPYTSILCSQHSLDFRCRPWVLSGLFNDTDFLSAFFDLGYSTKMMC